MIDPILFFGFLTCFSLWVYAITTARSGIIKFDYNGKRLKGGYICEVCGKPIIGKETQHTREECEDYRSCPYQPDHSILFGAEKYTRTPSYEIPKAVEG